MSEPEEEGDLYEKVDLTDDFRLPDEDDLDTSDDNDAMFGQSEKEDSSMPELDGEMIFSLDDPLDELTPDIKISDQEEKDR